MHSWERTSERPAGQWITTVARVVGEDNVLLVQADCSNVTLRIWRSSGLPDDNVPLREYTLAPADVIYDTPQDDAWWDSTLEGGDGYNFRHTLKVGDPNTPGANQLILSGGETYELEYEFTTYSKGPIFVVHHARVVSILSR